MLLNKEAAQLILSYFQIKLTLTVMACPRRDPDLSKTLERQDQPKRLLLAALCISWSQRLRGKYDAIGGQNECKRVVKWSAISQLRAA